MPRPARRLREFRETAISDPERRFVFQVVPRVACWHQEPTRVHIQARVRVLEDPETPGGLLVVVSGSARVVLEGAAERAFRQAPPVVLPPPLPPPPGHEAAEEWRRRLARGGGPASGPKT
jgi:hypothetical protein